VGYEIAVCGPYERGLAYVTWAEKRRGVCMSSIVFEGYGED
jgi:hypothetical protein